jgi:Tfp pilus assembly protein PilN
MSAQIYQQINLYQPIFRKQRQIFSAATMLGTAGIVAAALLVIYAYALWQVSGLEKEAVQLEGREKAYTTQLANLNPDAGGAHRKDVEAQLKHLNATLVGQQKLIHVLRDRPSSSTQGFSADLAALARRHVDGLWLTGVSINGGTGAIELMGAAVKPDLVPRYLQMLSKESALSGQRFDRLQIERSKDGAKVLFRASSRSVDSDLWQEKLASRKR